MTQPLIALEIHDVSLWEPSRVLPIIDVMERWGYNALVLHQNDLLDACTQLGLAANYGVTDLRLKKVRNNAAWLNRLVKRLDQFGARLFLEIKEPSFHDYALEFYPDLIGADGILDPMHPVWAYLCRRKTDDLLKRVPGFGGLIVNLSSPESRVSMPDHVATQGGDHDKSAWFDRMIGAFKDPLAAAAKALYVRDFSYTADMQSDVLAAIARCDGHVGSSVKITAHDYFPEFPQNPAAQIASHPLIFEFEAFGEHTGWGVIPNCRVAEFQQRMEGYRDLGADGLLIRISWEAITGAHALDTLSVMNVFALPKLIHGDADPTTLVMDWLHEAFNITGTLAERATDLLLQSWEIPAAAYWNGKVFPRHSCLPSTWQDGWLSMESSGMGRRDWELNVAPDHPDLSDAARVELFKRKEKATELAARLAEDATALAKDLPPELAKMFAAFSWLPPFAQQFELATKATFYAARGGVSDLAELPSLVSAMITLADALEQRLTEHPDIPHHHAVLFDPDQIRRFVRSLPN